MSKSKIFFILCLSFISGIAVHSFISPDKRIGKPFWWYVGFLGFGILAVISYRKSEISTADRKRKPDFRSPSSAPISVFHQLISRGYALRFVSFGCLAMLSLGIFRYSQAIPVSDESHILHYVGQEVTVRGIIDAFPRLREKTAAYVVRVESIQGQSLGPRTVLEGKILLTAELFPRYDFGDELTFVCTPERLGKYEQYARREGVSTACAFPEHIAVTSSLTRPSATLSLRERDGVRATLYHIRQTFHARLSALFPNPYGGLLAGLLYGDTSGFSSDLKETFRITGISHITALSGYNVTILARVLIAALIVLWLTRKQALPVALLIIFGFVVATGAEASVVRAAIMGFLILGAKGIGRLSKMRVALSFAGAVMLTVNPMLLRFDLGFQLSFLATIALLWFADDIAKRTWMRYLPRPFAIREAGSASAAAILFTAPLLFYTTGMLGPLSLLVNILVVPIVPLAMAAGFAATAADFIFHPLGVAVSWIARVPLEYIIEVAEYFARFGAVYVQMSAAVAVVTFLAIVAGIWWWKRKNTISYGRA